VTRKSEGPGIAAAAAEAQKVDTLGRRINREAKSSFVYFQAIVAANAVREFLASLGGER
jgi:hypothetical protein